MVRSKHISKGVFALALLFVSSSPALATPRENYYTESLGESSYNSNTSYQDKATLTFTPADNSAYLIIASWQLQMSSTNYVAYSKLVRTSGTATDLHERVHRPKDNTDYVAGGSAVVETFGTSPGSQTYVVQYRTSSTAGTARIKNASIIAIRLNSDDQYTASTARSTTTSSSYQDKATLTFTPATSGDYLIIASASVDSSSTSRDWRAQLDIDGSTYNNSNVEPVSTSNRNSWGAFRKINLSNASHTAKIQYSIESGATAGITYAHLIALRLDQFAANYYGETNTYTTYTNTSYQSHASVTGTPTAADHLILGYAGGNSGSGTYSGFWQLEKGGSSYAEMLVEPRDPTSLGFPYFVARKESLSAASTTWNMQARTENASIIVGIKDSQIAVLELNEPGAPPSVSISLATDGAVAFGLQALNTTRDTTAGDHNDVETISVDSGPADLDIESTNFTESTNTWTLGSGSGADQVKWEFSKDGSAWSTFLAPATNYTFDTSVATSASRSLYLRLTTPTSTNFYNQFTSTVTVTASAP